MKRRTFTAGALALAAAPGAARAQQPRLRVPHVAWLSPNPAGDFRSQAFREGLRQLGYVEGETIVVDFFTPPSFAELSEYARRAVASGPDVIVTTNTAVVQARAATNTIPIVMSGVADPLAAGYVTNLARPGGNITGLSLMIFEMIGKRIQLLSEIVGGLSTIALIYNVGVPNGHLTINEARRTARLIGAEILVIEVQVPADLPGGIAAAAAQGAQTVYLQSEPLFTTNAKLAADELLKHKLPAIYDQRVFPDSGGLVAYGANLPDNYRRAAYYVDRILKGAKPGDLPVEQPTVFDFVINLKTARALGLTVPEHLMVFATEVIE